MNMQPFTCVVADGKPAFCFADGCVKQAVIRNYEIYNKRIYFQLRQMSQFNCFAFYNANANLRLVFPVLCNGTVYLQVLLTVFAVKRQNGIWPSAVACVKERKRRKGIGAGGHCGARRGAAVEFQPHSEVIRGVRPKPRERDSWVETIARCRTHSCQSARVVNCHNCGLYRD
jgi:hypothetical protein